MVRVRKAINNRGQVLIESMVISMAVIGLVTLVFVCSYLVIARKWADYWVYRAAVCQATEVAADDCRSKLENKLADVLPASFYQLEFLWLSPRESYVAIRLTLSEHLTMRIESRVPLPLGR